MTKFPEPTDPNDWSPVTSRPGEIHTVEGEIKMWGAFARGLHNNDPRLRPYRHAMWRSALYVMALAVALAVIVGVLSAVL